jgi:hypothetical protein
MFGSRVDDADALEKALLFLPPETGDAYAEADAAPPPTWITTADLSDAIVDVCGVLLPRTKYSFFFFCRVTDNSSYSFSTHRHAPTAASV